MNWDQIEGKWKQLSGQVRETWGDLTDDDMTEIGGRRDKFVGKLQERYGLAKDEAESKADELARTVSDQT